MLFEPLRAQALVQEITAQRREHPRERIIGSKDEIGKFAYAAPNRLHQRGVKEKAEAFTRNAFAEFHVIMLIAIHEQRRAGRKIMIAAIDGVARTPARHRLDRERRLGACNIFPRMPVEHEDARRFRIAKRTPHLILRRIAFFHDVENDIHGFPPVTTLVHNIRLQSSAQEARRPMRKRWKRAIPALKPALDDVSRMVCAGIPGAQVTGFAELEGGLANTNIRVDLKGPLSRVLLRLYQLDPSQAAKEAAIARRLEGLVSVPRVLYISEDGGQRFALAEWIEGTRLELVLSDGTARTTLGRAVGAALARIHSVEFEKAGTLDDQLRIKEPMAADNGFLIDFLRASLIDGAGARHMPKALAQAVIDYAEQHRALEWGGPVCLTHFDYNGSNILVRDGGVVAVVDWEFAMAAGPAPDFGNLIRNHPQGDFVEAAAQGYRNAGGLLPSEWRKIARIADLAAWADFLNRPSVTRELVEDALRAMRETIAG